MTKAEKRAAWLKQMADPKEGRYKSCWWAGSLTAAELEEWILELMDSNKRLEAMKIALEGKTDAP